MFGNCKVDECVQRELRGEIKRLRAVLAFYANPFTQRDEHGDLVQVPDFYNELDFGAKAFEALTRIDMDTLRIEFDDLQTGE